LVNFNRKRESFHFQNNDVDGIGPRSSLVVGSENGPSIPVGYLSRHGWTLGEREGRLLRSQELVFMAMLGKCGENRPK
jgi:hypothetical protein